MRAFADVKARAALIGWDRLLAEMWEIRR